MSLPERSSLNTYGNTTQTTTYYVVAGKRIAANVNGTFYYFGYDALGSQVIALNSSGTTVGSQLYGPYGNQRYSTGTLPTSIGFTGQRADSVTGLDYYNARYYDPTTGVFLSADSVQGNAQGMEPYAYVGENPESRVDPTGQRIACPPDDTQSCLPDGSPRPPGQSKCPAGQVPNKGGCVTDQPSGNDCAANGQVLQGGKCVTPTKPSPSCKGTLIFGLCVANVGRFLQGAGEVFGSLTLLIAALVGAFQASGILWLITQGLQYIMSGILVVMKNGISNILQSLDGAPGKGFKIFLDVLQIAGDLAAEAVNIISLWKNIGKVLKYPGGSFSTKWGGVVKAAGTMGAKNMNNATTQLAIASVANGLNTLLGGDFLVNDLEQLGTDFNSPN